MKKPVNRCIGCDKVIPSSLKYCTRCTAKVELGLQLTSSIKKKWLTRGTTISYSTGFTQFNQT